jgi:vesicle transport protein SEC22
MGIEYLCISRISDGLALVASMDSAPSSTSSTSHNNSNGINNGQQLRARVPGSNIGGGGAPGNQLREGKELLTQLTVSSPPRCSVDGQQFTYHYSIHGPIVVFCATDKQYPKKLAFVYLEEVRKLFYDHVTRETGDSDVARVISSIDRPYYFIKFDRELRNIRREFADPGSRQNMQRLQDSLHEIQNIMRKNIDELVNRGDSLVEIRNSSQKLHEESKSLAWGAKKLNRLALLRRYGPMVGGVLVLLFFLWVRFYVML